MRLLTASALSLRARCRSGETSLFMRLITTSPDRIGFRRCLPRSLVKRPGPRVTGHNPGDSRNRVNVEIDFQAMTARRTAGPVDTGKSPSAALRTLDALAVAIEGGLWTRRQAVNCDAALPHGLRMLEAAGNLDNLRIAAGRATGQFRGRVFADSDVYKWLEAAACEMARTPSAWLRSSSETLIELAAFFLDQRGRGRIGPNRYNSAAAFQDRVPVREAATVEGHAVRALYLATGVADLYLETGEAALLQALTRQWDDMVGGKLYVT